jgi:hypothetical protein
VNQGEIRQLVHHDLRLDLHHRPGQGRRVEDVDDDGLDVPAPQRTGARGRTRRPKDHRSALQE